MEMDEREWGLEAVWKSIGVAMFNPHLSSCQDVSRQFDLGEVALADGFE